MDPEQPDKEVQTNNATIAVVSTFKIPPKAFVPLAGNVIDLFLNRRQGYLLLIGAGLVQQ